MGGQSRKQAVERAKRDNAIEKAYTAYIQDFLQAINDKMIESGIVVNKDSIPEFSPVEKVAGEDVAKCNYSLLGTKDEKQVIVYGVVDCHVNKTEEVGVPPYSFSVNIEKIEESS